MSNITYATKVWEGEFLPVLERHKNAQLIIANNMKKKIVDIGETDEPYYIPELNAIWACQTEYILWYAGDVIPPETDWVADALPLLDNYPIVTCRFDDTNQRKEGHLIGVVDVTDFGWTTYHFSDQCYIARTNTMRDINYNIDHPIKNDYPKHGGNSFERRVGQFLAFHGTPMAVLDNHRYRHLDRTEK